jgi:hypothetical protein
MAEREDSLGLREEAGTGFGTNGTHGARKRKCGIHKTILRIANDLRGRWTAGTSRLRAGHAVLRLAPRT